MSYKHLKYVSVVFVPYRSYFWLIFLVNLKTFAQIPMHRAVNAKT